MRRCEKGKPCGATCIERLKICQMDVDGGLSGSLKKVADEVGTEPKTQKPTTSSLVKLSKLDDYMDLYNKSRETSHVKLYQKPELLKANSEVAKLLGSSNPSFPNSELYEPGEKAKYDGIRSRIGEQKLNDALVALQLFSLYPEVHMGVRGVEKGDPKYPNYSLDFKKYSNYANQINDFLTSREVPRPEVEKFRGFRASPDHLREMIKAAKGNESFSNNYVSSWSSSMGIGRKFADTELFDKPDRTERIIYRAINRKGVPIEFVTRAREEDELLTPRNTEYRYLGYREIKKTGTNEVYHIFDVEELP